MTALPFPAPRTSGLPTRRGRGDRRGRLSGATPSERGIDRAPVPAHGRRPAGRAAVPRAASPDVGRRPLAPTSRGQALRRQSVAAALLVLALVLVLVATGVGRAATPVAPPSAVAFTTVVVAPGETVWEIAARNAPGGTSTADYAARITELNALPGGAVDAWQVLRLP